MFPAVAVSVERAIVTVKRKGPRSRVKAPRLTSSGVPLISSELDIRVATG
jgi:hypothetical protein